MADQVSDFELDAFVDGQLDMARRIEVEDYLSRHPEAAARVMANLRINDQVRLLQAQRAPVSASSPLSMVTAARKLERGLTLSWWRRGFVRTTVAAALIGLGWVGSVQLGPTIIRETEASPTVPSYVAEAVAAHRVSLLRAAMPSQAEDPEYDPDEIFDMTAITVPRLPSAWHVLDVQVFPSKAGPSVEMVVSVPDRGTLSIFTVRAPAPGQSVPRHLHAADQDTFWWYQGSFAYALTGAVAPDALEDLALDLVSELR